MCPTAVQAQEPTSETVLQSIRASDQASDEELVERATLLLKARAGARISLSTYADGVHYFRTHHPEFYGAFFGDPFYAGYDVRYFELTRARRSGNLDVNPSTSSDLFDSAWLFCHPYAYDPAFGGVCRGFTFPPGEFWILPLFAQLSLERQRRTAHVADTRTDLLGRVERRRSDEGDAFEAPDRRPRRPDTTRSPTMSTIRPDRPSSPGIVDAPDPVDVSEVGAVRPIDVSDLEPTDVPRRVVERRTLSPDRYEHTLRTLREMREWRRVRSRRFSFERGRREIHSVTGRRSHSRSSSPTIESRSIERVEEAARRIERHRTSRSGSSDDGNSSTTRVRRSGNEKENR